MPRQYSVAENSSSWNLSNTPNTLGSIRLWPQGRHMAAIKVTDCVCTQPYSALSGVSVILNSASAMDQIISCLYYLSWSVMKFEAVTQQSILPEGKTHSLHTKSTCGGSNSQSMHEKSGFFRLIWHILRLVFRSQWFKRQKYSTGSQKDKRNESFSNEGQQQCSE